MANNWEFNVGTWFKYANSGKENFGIIHKITKLLILFVVFFIIKDKSIKVRFVQLNYTAPEYKWDYILFWIVYYKFITKYTYLSTLIWSISGSA